VRILITGSRYGWDEAELESVLKATVEELAYEGVYLPGVDEPPVLVHGDARGVDRQAARIWQNMGLPTEPHPYIKQLGKAGGPARNQQMVSMGANLCLAFLDPDSKGTKDCVERAEKAGILVRTWTR
jgi:hypothetical protein